VAVEPVSHRVIASNPLVKQTDPTIPLIPHPATFQWVPHVESESWECRWGPAGRPGSHPSRVNLGHCNMLQLDLKAE
jgi:hypothetical protein